MIFYREPRLPTKIMKFFFFCEFLLVGYISIGEDLEVL